MLTKLATNETRTAAGVTDSLSVLNTEIANCSKCPGMNIPGKTQSAPGYGSPTSPIMLIGQSLWGPCMETGIPFTGGSGRFIDAALALAGHRRANFSPRTSCIATHPTTSHPSQPGSPTAPTICDVSSH
jgi:DNA polymerase